MSDVGIKIFNHYKPQNGINGYRIGGGLVADWLQRSSTAKYFTGVRGIPKLITGYFQTTFSAQYLHPLQQFTNVLIKLVRTARTI
jgi:hypothetical protein